MTVNQRWMIVGILSCVLAGTSGCGSSSSTDTEDSSTSGSVVSAVGGGANGSSSGGTMAQYKPSGFLNLLFASVDMITNAFASASCPTYSASLLGAGEQTYSDCSFLGSSAVWNGGVTFTGSTNDVTRVVANSTTRTASSGTVVTIDTTGSGLTPFNGDSAPSGGTTYTPSSLAINGVNFVAKSSGGKTLFNHVVTTSSSDGGSTLSISGSTITGTAITYHQLAKIKATSVVNLTLSSTCCLPIGGTVITTFNTSATGAEAKYNGKTETLTITGCGTATYTGPEGYSGSVTLAHCL